MFQEILFKKNTPRGEYRKSENFSEKDLRQMYAIFEKYYENVNFEGVKDARCKVTLLNVLRVVVLYRARQS